MKLFYPDGSLRYEGEGENGEQHGQGKSYHQNGGIHSDGKWHRGAFQSGKIFSPSGRLLARKDTDSDEGETTFYRFDRNGEVKLKVVCTRYPPEVEAHTFERGLLREKHLWEDNFTSVTTTHYFPDGKVSLFSTRDRTGYHLLKLFYPAGFLYLEKESKNDSQSGYLNVYYPHGSGMCSCSWFGNIAS